MEPWCGPIVCSKVLQGRTNPATPSCVHFRLVRILWAGGGILTLYIKWRHAREGLSERREGRHDVALNGMEHMVGQHEHFPEDISSLAMIEGESHPAVLKHVFIQGYRRQGAATKTW